MINKYYRKKETLKTELNNYSVYQKELDQLKLEINVVVDEMIYNIKKLKENISDQTTLLTTKSLNFIDTKQYAKNINFWEERIRIIDEYLNHLSPVDRYIIEGKFIKKLSDNQIKNELEIDDQITIDKLVDNILDKEYYQSYFIIDYFITDDDSVI